ncbi:MAG: AMP-binding protein [Oscillospiraceae bacterium]
MPFGRALREIDRTADAYQALGVLPGEIVTCCSLAIPETVYSLYGLNKIGGVSNMIDPRASSKGIRNFVAETGSRVLVILDAILEKNLDMLPELDVDTIIVQTAERSLPPMVRLLKRFKDGAVRLPADKRIVLWDDFLRAGAGANAQPVPYRENMLAVINHTGGTTGVPKGVMLTNDGMNAMSVNFGLSGVNYRRDNRFLDIIPPFASYGVVVQPARAVFARAGGRAHPAVRPGKVCGHGPALPPDAHAGCPVALRAADERRADPKNGPCRFSRRPVPAATR